MAGNKEGGKKAAATNKKRWGKDWYARIGRIGGQRCGSKKGFAAMPIEKVKAAGRKGGCKSSRAGIPNGEGKTKKSGNFVTYNEQKKIYVHHRKSSKQSVEVQHD